VGFAYPRYYALQRLVLFAIEEAEAPLVFDAPRRIVGAWWMRCRKTPVGGGGDSIKACWGGGRSSDGCDGDGRGGDDSSGRWWQWQVVAVVGGSSGR